MYKAGATPAETATTRANLGGVTGATLGGVAGATLEGAAGATLGGAAGATLDGAAGATGATLAGAAGLQGISLSEDKLCKNTNFIMLFFKKHNFLQNKNFSLKL
jgi:hypothetical protein